MDVYRKADDRIRDFIEWISLQFNKLRKWISPSTSSKAIFDELNVLYREIDSYGRNVLMTIAQEAYDDEVTKKYRHFQDDFLILILDEPNPYTTVTYSNELERRAERFSEQITAAINRSLQSEDRRNENGVKIPLQTETKDLFRKEFNSLSLLFDSYMIDTVDKAREEAFADDGIRRVRWVTVLDGKECEYCRKLNGHVFAVKQVPTKPHPHCRCYTIRFD